MILLPLCVALVASLFAGSGTVAGPADAPQPVLREVLALYDGAQEAEPAETRIHRYAEVALNHLGYVVTYRDVREPLPGPEALAQAAGIITWFRDRPASAADYLAWAAKTARGGRRFIVLGYPGGDFWTTDFPLLNGFLGALGLRHAGRAVELTAGVQPIRKSQALTEFERRLDPVLPAFPVLAAARGDVEPWLQLAIPVREGGGRSVVIAVGASGGVALQGFDVVEELGLGRVRWLVDPFAFFAKSLGGKAFPVPDLTTVSGRRMVFSHVDGDGLNNIAALPGLKDTLAPRVFLDRIVKAYPDIPVTLALTPGDLDPAIGGNETPREIVREIWQQPNVEAAVESYTRPFEWGFFARYDRAAEMARLDELDARQGFSLRRLLPAMRADAATSVSRYVASGPPLPRGYMLRAFDLDQETAGALDAARSIEPPGRPIRLTLWSGDAKPFEAAIRATRQLGLLNLNGGETRFDASYPSVAYVRPIARPVGAERQVYAVGGGEIPVEKEWRPAPAALEGLATTIARTEEPRRLKPFNLHYHLASVGEPATLRWIESYLDQVRGGPYAPVSAADYAAMAGDFFGVEIAQAGENTWRVGRRGAIQTVRFDEPGGAIVDLARSPGVLGQRTAKGALYVALDSAVEPALVTLGTPGDRHGPVSLLESRWSVSALQRQECGFLYKARGYGPGEFVWEGVPSRPYAVTALRAGSPVWSETVEAQDGRLSFTVAETGVRELEIEVSCDMEGVGP